MTAFFEKIPEMSATASVVIVVVLLIRLLLKKAPRKYSYALWAVAAFRLVCPVSFRSVFSIFTLTGAVKPAEAVQTPVMPPVAVVTPPAATFAPDVIATAPPAAVVTPPAVTVTPPAVTEPITSAVSFWDVAAVIWLAVLAGLLIYGVVSYVGLRRRMASAVLLEGNVYRSDRVRSPFILGFVRPKIYLPFGLTEEQRRYVLAHERYHIRRLDHIIRPVAFLILCIHWFNPLVWLAYYLMGRDMEMSCDEKVLGGAENIRKAYSLTLLSFAANRRFPSPSPLAFGETGVKGRIKNILSWKKPALWVTVVAIVLVAAVLLVCAADPREPSAGSTAEQGSESEKESEKEPEKEPEDIGDFSSPAGWFRSVECIFMNPLSSWIPMNGDSGYTYGVEGDALTMVHNGSRPTLGDSTGYSYSHRAEGGWQELTEELWREMNEGTLFLTDCDLWDTIGACGQRHIRRYEDGYFLLCLDEEVWVGRGSMHPNGERYLWDLYRLTPADDPAITVEYKLSLTADLNHDGSAEILTVSYDHVNETYKLTVSESIGMNVLLEWEFHRMENLSAGYYLYSREGKDYLLWWEPYCQQGVWKLYYEVISFDEKGGFVVLEQDERNYDDSHPGDSHLTADLDDLRAFEGKINSLLANATPLLVSDTANSGSILIGGKAELWESPADQWEAQRQSHQEDTSARERATLAVWPLNDLTVTLLKADESDDPFYTLDVFGNNHYFFWETQFHRVNHNLLYFRYEEKGVQYLMELSIGGGQGTGIWSYRIFTVGPESLTVLKENDLYFDAATYESMLTVDTAALRAFEAEVNALLDHAHLIGGVSGSKLVYNTPDSITTVYRMDTGMAELIGERQREAEQPQPSPVPTPAPEPSLTPEEVVTVVVMEEEMDPAEFLRKLGGDISIGAVGYQGIVFESATVVIEKFELGMAGQTMEHTLYRLTYTLHPGGERLIRYTGFHRDWADGNEKMYELGTITEEELLARYGHLEGADRYRTALQEMFDTWRKTHSCLCGA